MLVAVGFVNFDDLNRGKNGKSVNVARKIEYPGFMLLYIYLSTTVLVTTFLLDTKKHLVNTKSPDIP